MAATIEEEISQAKDKASEAKKYLFFLQGMKREIDNSRGNISYRDGVFHGVKLKNAPSD